MRPRLMRWPVPFCKPTIESTAVAFLALSFFSSSGGAGCCPPSGPIAAGQYWPRHPRCDHSPRWDSPSTSAPPIVPSPHRLRSEEHTSELQSLRHLVCRLLLEKTKLV